MVFLAVTYGCESWTIKKAECQRIDAFELWCWRRHLESPLDCRGPHHFLSPLAVVSLLPTPGVCTAQQGQQGALLALAGGQLQEGRVSLRSPPHLAEFPVSPPSSLGREAGCALGRGDKEHGRRDRSKGPVWKLRSSPRSNQSILKGINPEYLLEGLMLKLKTPILWPHDVKN